MDPALSAKAFDRRADFATRQLLDCLLQLQVALPDDLIQFRCPHTGFLKLSERPARFDSLMLPRVADQENAVIGSKPFNKFVHLAGGGERRFVEYIQPLLAGIGPLSPGKMMLKR
jgi:hypothetical protein